MRRLGKVLKISLNKYLLVRADFAPREGAYVYDKRMRKIGSVYDIIGPVSRPYVVVVPQMSDFKSLLFSDVYVKPHDFLRRRRRR
ncbi:MAG: hypothetical protein DRJ52_02970 [Thermoprotei archaeon]|nr:MAG: hypothetical protein DRJ52_02970 [Thermoprotei archaeon]RLF01038.1 MAG: hypothetical protein DRJ63_00445 [Thermoprotei archaeon]HDI74444.1 hypothetical protein [Thermoprotei archaeon]